MENYKVFIIDDEVDNLKTFVSIFEEHRPNYDIFQTNNSSNALHIATKVKPDVIVTDWDMPHLSGIDLIRQLKKFNDTKDIPVVMATGVHLSSEDLQIALESGATDFIKKPIDPLELVARTHAALLLSDYHKQIVETKDQELTESSLQLVKNNKFTLDITKKLHELSIRVNSENQDAQNLLQEIISELNNRIQEDSWFRFNLSFDKVHKDFNKNLVAKYPDLTAGELKLCAFIRLGMGNKDIASVLNQNPDSIKVARSRLRKKLNIDQSQNLETYLSGF